MNVTIRLGGFRYVYTIDIGGLYSAGVYLQCSYLQVFFYYKSVFSPFRLGPYARIKLRFKTFKIKYFWAQNTIKMKREVRQIHWYTAEKEKTNDTKVIKDQTYCIFL